MWDAAARPAGGARGHPPGRQVHRVPGARHPHLTVRPLAIEAVEGDFAQARVHVAAGYLRGTTVSSHAWASALRPNDFECSSPSWSTYRASQRRPSLCREMGTLVALPWASRTVLNRAVLDTGPCGCASSVRTTFQHDCTAHQCDKGAGGRLRCRKRPTQVLGHLPQILDAGQIESLPPMGAGRLCWRKPHVPAGSGAAHRRRSCTASSVRMSVWSRRACPAGCPASSRKIGDADCLGKPCRSWFTLRLDLPQWSRGRPLCPCRSGVWPAPLATNLGGPSLRATRFPNRRSVSL